MHKNYSQKPAEDWCGIRLHGTAGLPQDIINTFAAHGQVETCHYTSSQWNDIASLTIYLPSVYNIDEELAAVVPTKYCTPSFAIGVTDKVTNRRKYKYLHTTPTPTITPQEVSMAFKQANRANGDKPHDFDGHRGNIYVSWVTEQGKDDDTFLGLFRH
eukprot:1290691-Ditylum_brightwellii.AAC.1